MERTFYFIYDDESFYDTTENADPLALFIASRVIYGAYASYTLAVF